MHILFLGNGFDLYHGLKTSYLDFLKIIQHLDEFKSDIEFYLNNPKEDDKDHLFKDYFSEITEINAESIGKIYSLLYGNIWSIYYGECNANIQGWIDFENEMNPVFDLFRNLFFKGVGVNSKDRYLANSTYLAESYKEVAIAKILTMFFEDEGNAIFRIKEDYFDEKYGLLKDKIVEKLEKDLEDFTLAFNIYLRELVELKQITEYKWIKELNPSRVISFNYTKTEATYFTDIPVESRAHLHGVTDWNNIVFGTDLIDDEDIEFIHFSKRYQRLVKVGDYSYINFLEDPCDFTDLYTNGVSDDFVVSFIGCSLDKNDSPIFSEYINKADKINIYCYGFEGYKNTVGNLISIFGSKKITEYNRVGKIIFLIILG